MKQYSKEHIQNLSHSFHRRIQFKKHGIFPITIALIASSGLAYELIAGTLATYLLGSSITQFSFATGWFLASMGIGSYATKYIRRLLRPFVYIQFALAIFGGYSALLMFYVFSWIDNLYTIFFLNALFLGTLIGAEIPIIIRIVRRYRLLRIALAHVLALDYLGALITSIAFPLLLLPFFGLIRASLIFGGFNLLAGGLMLYFFPRKFRRRYIFIFLLCFTILTWGFIMSERILMRIEADMYQDPIIYASTTRYQRVILTRWHDDIRLYLDGDLQFSSRDEHRYHEALVHVPIAFIAHAPKRVVILGGGDGLALREVLRYPSVENVTLVDIDPSIIQLFSTRLLLVKLNTNAFHDHRVHVKNTDAFSYIKALSPDTQFDLIIRDLPDPDTYTVNRMYTVEFYSMMLKHLSPGGVFVTQATSPIYGNDAFACIKNSIEESCNRTVHCHVRAYHVYVPSFGDWGFVMAGENVNALPVLRFTKVHGLRFLTPDVFLTLFIWPHDFIKTQTRCVNRLNKPRLVYLYKKSWARWFD